MIAYKGVQACNNTNKPSTDQHQSTAVKTNACNDMHGDLISRAKVENLFNLFNKMFFNQLFLGDAIRRIGTIA